MTQLLKKPLFWLVTAVLIAAALLGMNLYVANSPDNAPLQWAKNLRVQDIQKIELVVMPSLEEERYRLFAAEEFADIVALVNQSKGRFLRNPEPIAGSSSMLYITTTDGVRHTVANGGNTYLTIDGATYKASYDWLAGWGYKKGNARLPDDLSF